MSVLATEYLAGTLMYLKLQVNLCYLYNTLASFSLGTANLFSESKLALTDLQRVCKRSHKLVAIILL